MRRPAIASWTCLTFLELARYRDSPLHPEFLLSRVQYYYSLTHLRRFGFFSNALGSLGVDMPCFSCSHWNCWFPMLFFLGLRVHPFLSLACELVFPNNTPNNQSGEESLHHKGVKIQSKTENGTKCFILWSFFASCLFTWRSGQGTILISKSHAGLTHLSSSGSRSAIASDWETAQWI